MLEGNYPYIEHGHKIWIKNGTRDHAFIRVNDLASKKHSLLYLTAGDQGSFDNLADGFFEVMFAFGGRLASDCSNIASPNDVQKFPDGVKLFNVHDATGVTVTSVTYTLYTVRGGNARSRPISLSEFNRD